MARVRVCVEMGVGESFSPGKVPSGPRSGHAPVGFQPHSPVLCFCGFFTFMLVLCTPTLMLVSAGKGDGLECTAQLGGTLPLRSP